LKGIKPFTDNCKVQLHAETQADHPEHTTLFFGIFGQSAN